MVAQSITVDQRIMPSTSTSEIYSDTSTQTKQNVSTSQNETRTFSLIRKSLKNKGISKQARDIILGSWRETTKRQYDGYIKKWINYCGQSKNPIKPNLKHVINFLTSLFKQGLSYSALNTARSALSTFLKLCGNINIHDDDILSRFMRGCFNTRPAFPRYQCIWDVNIVLDFLHSLKTDNLAFLSHKLCMLFLLVTGQRCQTLHSLKTTDIQISADKQTIVISPKQLLKHSRPGTHLRPIVLHRYEGGRDICIVETMCKYLDITESLRQDDYLVISTVSPFKHVSKSTISNWIKKVLTSAGIDKQYKPHSTRSAATSKASKGGVALDQIMAAAGWTNAKTFARFYSREIVHNTTNFQSAVLNK
ncbi:uncharacterized protein LOC127846782 isoform X2 [Dreissena polymorpha]|uniref:uncharacterized protein LOC127846782 isoform X2 n=1 Tax=Dreissena polymorpha TaxID=45954 RepID=UPI00226432F0|nr:uncharacterized protein LOC127846782 isoform X2 [Dreissena polymorpha]